MAVRNGETSWWARQLGGSPAPRPPLPVVLGVPRDWAASVGLDAASGIGWAGGCVGTGVTATNLAGR